MEFLKRSKFYAIALVILLSSLLCTSIPVSQAAQLTQEEIWSEIQKLKAEIAKLKDQITKLQAEIQILKGKPTIELPPLKKGQIPLNKVFEKIPGWKVTLTSYEFLKSGGLQFNFVIENLQDKPANFGFRWRSSAEHNWVAGRGYTFNPRIKIYILDEKTNKYYNPQVIPKDEVTLIPGMPVEGKIIFTQPELAKAKVIVFYFGFYGRYLAANEWKMTDVLAVGPIKLR